MFSTDFDLKNEEECVRLFERLLSEGNPHALSDAFIYTPYLLLISVPNYISSPSFLCLLCLRNLLQVSILMIVMKTESMQEMQT